MHTNGRSGIGNSRPEVATGGARPDGGKPGNPPGGNRAVSAAGDRTHPSNSGQQKVAEMLLNFFTMDELAKTWFVKK